MWGVCGESSLQVALADASPGLPTTIGPRLPTNVEGLGSPQCLTSDSRQPQQGWHSRISLLQIASLWGVCGESPRRSPGNSTECKSSSGVLNRLLAMHRQVCLTICVFKKCSPQTRGAESCDNQRHSQGSIHMDSSPRGGREGGRQGGGGRGRTPRGGGRGKHEGKEGWRNSDHIVDPGCSILQHGHTHTVPF